MPNTVSLQVCKFRDYNETKDISYGYRVYDDFDQDYDNNFTSMANVLDYLYNYPGGVVGVIRDHHPEFWDTVIDRGGLFYNGEWVNYDRREEGMLETTNFDQTIVDLKNQIGETKKRLARQLVKNTKRGLVQWRRGQAGLAIVFETTYGNYPVEVSRLDGSCHIRTLDTYLGNWNCPVEAKELIDFLLNQKQVESLRYTHKRAEELYKKMSNEEKDVRNNK